LRVVADVGVMNVINLAHGDLAVVAAYLALSVIAVTHIPAQWSFLIVVPIFAAIGYVVQRTLIQASLNRGVLTTLLVTFGLSAGSRTRCCTLSADSRSIRSARTSWSPRSASGARSPSRISTCDLRRRGRCSAPHPLPSGTTADPLPLRVQVRAVQVRGVQVRGVQVRAADPLLVQVRAADPRRRRRQGSGAARGR
jgi:hypothetical protein